MRKLFLLSSMVVTMALYLIYQYQKETLQQTNIDKLYKLLQKQQYIDPDFLIFENIPGVYSSEIHMNLMDKENSDFMALFRRQGVPDSNMFVTTFVLYALMEAEDLGQLNVENISFIAAIRAIENFIDKNKENNAHSNKNPNIIWSFWKQILQNDTWTCYPYNLNVMVNLYLSLPAPLQEIIVYLFGDIFDPSQIKSMVEAFRIPSDADDSSVAVAIGSFLRKYKPLVYKDFWKPKDIKYDEFYKELIKFSYQPFAKEGEAPFNVSNKIDPRTYYYIEPFLTQIYEDAKQKGVAPELTLFTTWILNEDTYVLFFLLIIKLFL